MKRSKKYKIGILIDQLILGGVQKIAVEDARHLEKLGHKVTLLILMKRGLNKNYKSFVKGVNIKFLSDSYPYPISKSIKFPIFSFFSSLHGLSPFLAPFVVKKNQFDIIISHGTTTCFTAQGLKFFNNIPYLAFIHDPMNYILKTAYSNSQLRKLFPLLTPLLKYLEKKLIEQSANVILDSKLHQQFISKTYKTKSIVLPAGSYIPKKVAGSRKNYVVAVSRWEKIKNPDLFIKLATDIPDLNIKIAGSWTNQSDYRNFKKSLKVKKLTRRIILYPDVTENKLLKLYKEARFYIHPIKEAFSMGGLKATANGCPIIIPNESGITNYLENNIDGIFPKNQNYTNFLSATKKLWQDPQLTQKLGKSAHQKVKALSWENHAQKLLELINNSFVPKSVNIIALETGHASESYLSGGDKLLEKMIPYLPTNFKVKVVVPEIGQKHWQQAKLKQVRLLTLPRTKLDNNPSPLVIFLAYLLRIIQSFIKLLTQKNVDVIYTSTGVFPDVTPAFLYKITHPKSIWIARIHHLILPPAKRPGPLIVNIASYILQGLSNLMIKLVSTKTLTLNNDLRNTLEQIGFPKNKIDILGAGIDINKINKYSRTNKKNYSAAFVGRLHPAKGIDDIVEIWKLVTDAIPSAKAVIIGWGTNQQKRQLNIKIKKLNLSKNLSLLGYLPENKLYKTLNTCKIFLFTDYEAGWGLAIGEAMALGLPVIGYHQNMFGDVFKKGYITSPVGDTKNISSEIIRVLQNQKVYSQLSNEATLEAQKLSWAQTTKKFIKVVNSLIS